MKLIGRNVIEPELRMCCWTDRERSQMSMVRISALTSLMLSCLAGLCVLGAHTTVALALWAASLGLGAGAWMLSELLDEVSLRLGEAALGLSLIMGLALIINGM